MVYRARFVDGLIVTVRRVNSGEGGQGKDDLYLEVQLLVCLNHWHAVRLCGFSEGHQSRFSFLHV
jgi:hypothetical protein